MKKVEFVWSLDLAITLKDCDKNVLNEKEIKDFADELSEIIDPGSTPDSSIKAFGVHNEDMDGFRLICENKNSLITAHFAKKKKTAYINIHSCHPYQPSMALNKTSDFFKTDKFTCQKIFRE
tara:strand:- start:886 stop:1251 length:366 start_codon:yes stop_codon:yes gene_type:complete